ncbi:MAG: hypothetical protein ACK4RX_08655 [Chitinophagaceae bacterium]
MTPTAVGQVVKFHSPLPDEDPKQLYVVLELITDVEKPRALIKAITSDPVFSPINTVLINDLETVQIDISELIGHNVTIITKDNTRISGKVVEVNKTENVTSLFKYVDGVLTNADVTVVMEDNRKRTGKIFVNKIPPNEISIRKPRKLYQRLPN